MLFAPGAPKRSLDLASTSPEWRDLLQLEHFQDVVELRSEQDFRDAVNNPNISAGIMDFSQSVVRHACDTLEQYILSPEGQRKIAEFEGLNQGILITRNEIKFPWENDEGRTVDPMIGIARKLLQGIGFTERHPAEAEILLKHMVKIRRMLHGFGEPASDLQVNTYSVVDVPHFHNDLGLLFPYAGDGPILIRNDYTQEMEYQPAIVDGRLKQIQVRSSPKLGPKDRLATGPYTMTLLKGRRDRSRPWALRSNVGSVHMSSGVVKAKGRKAKAALKARPEHFRFLTAHFIYDY